MEPLQQFNHGWLTTVGYKIGNSSFPLKNNEDLSYNNVILQCNEYLNLLALSLGKNV